MTENARGVVYLYLNTNSTWDYEELIRHIRTLFESGKTLSLLVIDFYSKIQWPWETEDKFANELHILSWKVICMRPSWKDKVDEALKTQFVFQLHDPYLAAMAHNYLKTQGQKMTFTQF